MIKHWICWFVLLVFLCSGIGREDVKTRIAAETGLDLSNAQVVHCSNSHGGFHGDGLTLARLLLPKETEPDFAKISGWQDQPGEAFCLLAYGIFRANGQIGPYIVEEDPLKTAFFPELSAGWYFLRDDSPETGPVIDRHSLNVTLAQYDPATHTLWYARLDT